MTRLLSHQSSGADPRRQLDAETLEQAASIAYPIVAHKWSSRANTGLVLGISCALLLGAFILLSMTISRTGHTNMKSPASVQVAHAAAERSYPSPTSARSSIFTPTAAAPLASTLPPMTLPLDRISPQQIANDGDHAAALIFDAPQSLAAAAIPVANANSASNDNIRVARTPAQGLTNDEQFAQRVIGDGESDAATSMEAPDATVAEGTLISAVLETALNSDLPGYVRAVISHDVRSFDGQAILIPRGSHAIGVYKSGLAVGQSRAFVLWTRLIRPDGVSIALGSPATDMAGSNGLQGKVNDHFGKRFGAAILLSMISAGGQAIGGGSGTLVIGAPTQAASPIAQQNANIPPTVRVSAGEPIRIFVAHDLDFSKIRSSN